MPSALVVETGAVVAGANTWISLADAILYFANRLRATDFTGASTDDQNRALLEAAVQLRDLVTWEGSLADEDQPLPWPRTEVLTPEGVELDGDAIPQFLKDAQCEQAKALLAGDRTGDQEVGLERAKADIADVTFDKYDRPHTLCRRARQLIAGYGTIKGRSRSREVVRV